MSTEGQAYRRRRESLGLILVGAAEPPDQGKYDRITAAADARNQRRGPLRPVHVGAWPRTSFYAHAGSGR